MLATDRAPCVLGIAGAQCPHHGSDQRPHCRTYCRSNLRAHLRADVRPQLRHPDPGAHQLGQPGQPALDHLRPYRRPHRGAHRRTHEGTHRGAHAGACDSGPAAVALLHQAVVVQPVRLVPQLLLGATP